MARCRRSRLGVGSASSAGSVAQADRTRRAARGRARASSSRRTARCGGICSSIAVISPISSNAAVTASEQGSRRSRGGRATVRSAFGLVGQLVAAELQVPEPVGGAGSSGQAGRTDSRSPSGVWSSAATCAWSRESRNRWTQRASGPASRVVHASSRRTRRPSSVACIASHREANASSSSSGCRPSGRPSRPRSRSSSESSQTLGRGGGSSSSRATTAPSHSRSARSASIAMAWCSGSNSRMVRMCCARDPGLAQPLPGPRGDLAVPGDAELEPRQVVDGPPLELGQPPDDGPPRPSRSRRPAPCRRAGGGPSSRPPRRPAGPARGPDR